MAGGRLVETVRAARNIEVDSIERKSARTAESSLAERTLRSRLLPGVATISTEYADVRLLPRVGTTPQA